MVAQFLRDRTLAPRCGRAEIARPHVCHGHGLDGTHAVAQFLRDHILEQARGRAISARPGPKANTYDPDIPGLKWYHPAEIHRKSIGKP